MSCAQTLGPGLAGLSAAIQTGQIYGSALFAQYCKTCPKQGNSPASRAAIRAIDDKAMCQVMCCCGGVPLHQQCVRETLDTADRLLGGHSRYKAEVSYNMMTRPPSPFMHRVNGAMSTVRSENWQYRAAQEIANYRPGSGMVRRPDVVIVDNPLLPPTQDNIARVVEMKFGNDVEQPGQFAAYNRIAGSADKFSVVSDTDCDCKNEKGKKVPLPIPVAVPAPQQQRQGNWWEIPAWGVATVVMGIVTVVAVLSPFEGPAGDIAAGAGTAASAARFAAAWSRVFGPAAAVAH